MKGNFEILKSRSGVDQNTSENRRLHRVGQRYGSQKKEDMKSPRRNWGESVDYDKLIEDIRKKRSEAEDKYYDDRIKLRDEHFKELEDLKKEIKNSLKGDTPNLPKYRELSERLSKLPLEYKEKSNLLRRQFEEYDERLESQEKLLIERKSSDEYRKKKEEQSKKAEIIPEENFTRVKFDDIPESGKVNLKKYLSDKIKKNSDSVFDSIKNLPTEELKKQEQQLVKNFNETFETSKKSVRAFNLYLIMKVKNELSRRNNEIINDPNKGYERFVELTGVQRGNPMTFEEANEMKANPFFNLGGEYRVNCQCCVVNYELRRRGFDVRSIGNSHKEGSYSTRLSRNQALAYIDPNTGKNPQAKLISSFAGNSLSGYKKSYKNLIVNFNEVTQEVGRYEFSFAWKGHRSSGHIVTAERFRDGSLRIYDPQCGKTQNIEDLFKQISLSFYMKVMRVDNLDIDQEFVSNIVTPYKEL